MLVINASPRMRNGNTNKSLEKVINKLALSKDTIQYLYNIKDQETIEKKLPTAEVILFAFPLYVDAPTSALLNLMKKIQSNKDLYRNQPIMYVLMNCGFYEAIQNETAIQIMKHFCDRVDFKWGQAFARGAGSVNAPEENLEPINKQCKIFAQNIKERKINQENLYIEPSITRNQFKDKRNSEWAKLVAPRGLKEADLHARPYLRKE